MLGTATLTGAALGGVAAVTVAPVLMLGAATASEAGEPCTIAAASAPAVTTTPAAIMVKGVIFDAFMFLLSLRFRTTCSSSHPLACNALTAEVIPIREVNFIVGQCGAPITSTGGSS
jgi:hypothetical protein